MPAHRFTGREWYGTAAFGRAAVRQIGPILAFALILGALGPFGTFALPVGVSVTLWLGFGIIGSVTFRPLVTASLRSRVALQWQAGRLVTAGGVAAVPATVLVAAVLEKGHVGLVTIAGLLQLYPYVLLIGLAASFMRWLIVRRASPNQEPIAVDFVRAVEELRSEQAAGSKDEASDAFLVKNAPHLATATIACMHHEDHYVNIHTDRGSALVLMRMRDAVDALANLDGMRVHRSWWVARSAVRHASREGRAWSLHLKDGTVVPVARSATPRLRTSGWLATS